MPLSTATIIGIHLLLIAALMFLGLKNRFGGDRWYPPLIDRRRKAVVGAVLTVAVALAAGNAVAFWRVEARNRSLAVENGRLKQRLATQQVGRSTLEGLVGDATVPAGPANGEATDLRKAIADLHGELRQMSRRLSESQAEVYRQLSTFDLKAFQSIIVENEKDQNDILKGITESLMAYSQHQSDVGEVLPGIEALRNDIAACSRSVAALPERIDAVDSADIESLKRYIAETVGTPMAGIRREQETVNAWIALLREETDFRNCIDRANIFRNMLDDARDTCRSKVEEYDYRETKLAYPLVDENRKKAPSPINRGQ